MLVSQNSEYFSLCSVVRVAVRVLMKNYFLSETGVRICVDLHICVFQHRTISIASISTRFHRKSFEICVILCLCAKLLLNYFFPLETSERIVQQASICVFHHEIIPYASILMHFCRELCEICSQIGRNEIFKHSTCPQSVADSPRKGRLRFVSLER